MLTEFVKRLEVRLNGDAELQRRLSGFKTFSGKPDGHYTRAREHGASALARAVKCYPFGGTTLLDERDLIGIYINDTDAEARFLISLNQGKFSVKNGDWNSPCLTLELSKEKFKKVVLGRYRWLWLIAMDDVKVSYSRDLYHSDWVTLLEILVVLQELVEFETDLWEKIEAL